MALRTDDETDKKYNPYEKVSGGLSDQENAALSGLEDNYANSADTDDENKNILKSLKNQEGHSGNWINSTSGIARVVPGKASKFIGTFTGKKSKGPLAFIISLVLGSAAMMGVLVVPGIGIVQMKEVMVGDLNDQLAAVTKRSDKVLLAKVQGLSSNLGICQPVSIKCKFSTFSSKQVKRFQDAGFQVTCDGGCKTGLLSRNKVTGLKFEDPITGELLDLSDPNKLQSASFSNKNVKSALKKAFNPKFEAFADKTFRVVMEKLKISKASIFSAGSTDEEKAKALKSATAGEDASGQRVTADVAESEGTKTSTIDGVPVEEGADLKANTIAESAGSVADTGVKATKSVATGALKGIGVLGVTDTACTVYNTVRAVSAMAKIVRALQLAQFAMVFLTTADSIKAGTATPDEVEYIGNKLSATDTQKEIYDEFSGVGTNNTSANPAYNKNAFDSAGYKVAAYNEAPTLTSRSQQFMVGGGLSGTLSGVLNTVNGMLGGTPESSCKYVQNWAVRGVSLVAGVAMAIGSFGATTAVSIGASVAISFALPFLEAMMADMIAGNVVNDTTDGVDAGDAIFVGSSTVFGQTAQARGMTPGNSESLARYATQQSQVAAEYEAYERELAAATPFDVMNQYSFLGSLTRSVATINNTVSTNNVSSLAQIVLGGFSSLTSSVNAIDNYNPDRFTKCDDADYVKLDIDADVFCNVRFVASDEVLNADTTDAVNFMVDGGYIDSISGVADERYGSWLKNCVNRTSPWGISSKDDAQDGEGETDGSECLKPGTYTNNELLNFQVYTMDASITDAMDEEDVTNEAVAETGGTVTSGGGSVNIISGTNSELFQIIKDSGVRDTSGDISSENSKVSNEILQVLASLADAGNSFTVSSFVRNYNTVSGDYVSLHVTGEAFDISARSGINGKTVTSYSDYNQTYQDFLDQIVTVLKPFGKNCQIGVPNSRYEAYAERSSECNVFVDIGTGVHFHVGAGRPY